MGDLKRSLYWLMGLRVVVVTLLLGLSIAFQIVKGQRVDTFYAFIVGTYTITILYAAVNRYLTSPWALTQFAYFQIGIDLLLETILVAMTGGIESPFAVLFVITVSLSSLMPRRRVGLATSSGAVILFGLVTNFQLFGAIDPEGWIQPSRLSVVQAFHTFGVHGLAFVVVGFLSGALADQLRQADQTLLEKERGLSRLQAFHENIVQSISSGVFTADKAGQITSFNPAAQEITGFTWEQVSGRPWREVFTWDQPESTNVNMIPMLDSHRFEVEGTRADGSRLILGMTISPLNEGGVRTGTVGVFKDLTQIRDMEEEMKRREWLATLGEMSAGMAHEIRNPLGAMTGAMQILRQDISLEETNRHLMDIAIREATRLDGIIKEFLLYARPPALNLKDCDLNGVLKETLDLILREAESREGISIKTQLAGGSLTAQVDADQLKQVFWNLATNAFQAMHGGGLLTISTHHREMSQGRRGGKMVEIMFRDTGEGIKKEYLDKIFLPFFTTKKQGSGLGLSAIDRIVDLHGGWVRVESEEGMGALFAVCLPCSGNREPHSEAHGEGLWKKS